MISVDIETYYDKDYTVADMGVHKYVDDPRFDPYRIYVSGSVSYHGPLEGAPWKKMDDLVWVSHNAQFDEAVYWKWVEKTRPDFIAMPVAWHCTADLCSYLQVPRSLKDAVKALYGKDVDKGYRVVAKGKHYDDFTDDEKIIIDKAGKADAQWCLRIAKDFKDSWPVEERTVSLLTRTHACLGVTIDWDELNRQIAIVQGVRDEARVKIPWTPPLSPKGLKEYCKLKGIPAPSSTAKDSEELADWLEEFGDQYDFVQAVRDFRRANTRVRKYESVLNLRRDDDTVPTYLRYYGAAITGRWSGGAYGKRGTRDSSVNWQNLDGNAVKRGETFGTDLRACVIPRPKHKFVIADLSQIEPRVLAWLAGDDEFLRLVRTMSPYEAHARASMGWTGGDLKEEDPMLYALAKARVLALGYGAGWQKFIVMAKMYGVDVDALFGMPPDPDVSKQFSAFMRQRDDSVFKAMREAPVLERRTSCNAWAAVRDYRMSNPAIVGLWDKYDKLLRDATHDGHFETRTPSGRPLRYFDVRMRQGGVTAKPVKGMPGYEYFYGGKIVQNLTQATARDVFAHHLCLIHRNIPAANILWTVHDEVILEVPDRWAKPVATAVKDTMSKAPTWLEGCPLAADVNITEVYEK